MGGNRNKLAISLVCMLAAASIFFVMSASTHDRNTLQPAFSGERTILSLNDTLTNSMSDIRGLSGMDRLVEAYRKRWDLRGLSLAVMRNDSLLFAKGYGWADEEKNIPMGPGNILRMASVSKLITATGIMKLQETGKLALGDTVFGPSGILCDSMYTAALGKKRNYMRITVEHLLRHKGGFTCSLGDPMFPTRDIIRQVRLHGAPDTDTLT